MNTKTVLNSIEKNINKNNENIINDLLLFLETKLIVSDELRKYINEFKNFHPIKKKREPSIFNLFVKDTSNEIKSNNKDIKSNDVLKEASNLWKNSDKGKFIKEYTDNILINDKHISKKEIYRQALIKWQELSI